jgi:hypothetical protein
VGVVGIDKNGKYYRQGVFLGGGTDLTAKQERLLHSRGIPTDQSIEDLTGAK